MNIDILCNDGSPLGVTSKTVWGDNYRIGLGGAELALITMCEEWTRNDNTVRLYNDPWEKDVSSFEQLPISSFAPNDKRDVLIVFRSPNIRSVPVNNCLKVWWSCDQFTVGDFKHFSDTVDKIVCISDFHKDYFEDVYGIKNTVAIDLPVRIADYMDLIGEMKIRNRIIFTSVPDRGLQNLWRIWPKIKIEVPDASLVITSDYRLWGANPGNEHYKVKFLVHEDVEFIGAVPRNRLLKEQYNSELFLYPCNYEELFCIAASEAQYAGAFPITSGKGALKTTNMGVVIHVDSNDPRNDSLFVKEAVSFLNNSNKNKMIWDLREMAFTRFSPETILKEWNEKVFNS